MFNIFIGLVLGVFAYYGSIPLAVVVGCCFLILNPRIKLVVKPVNQSVLDNKIKTQQVEKYSEIIIGTYLDNPIHSFIIVKNPANGVCYQHDYFDIIQYNGTGHIIVPPESGEIYLLTGLIYKDTGLVVSN